MSVVKETPKVITIAGSDSGGGAGIQADLKTFAALGCYGSTVITALTAQNTQGVQAVEAVSVAFVIQQLRSVLSDIGGDAIKMGMLYRQEIIEALAQELVHCNVPIVLDTVMIAKGGHFLITENAISTMKEKLFPLAILITPNIPEAESLVNSTIKTKRDMEKAVLQLATQAQSVLLKGGHLEDDECSDCFYDANQDKIVWFNHPRINTKNTHGTGCTLSSAIAAFLARAYRLNEAIEAAIEYTHHAILSGQNKHIGQGHGPVDHFFHG